MAQFDEKNTFLTEMTSFFANFCKNASIQKTSYIQLYFAHFDEKNTGKWLNLLKKLLFDINDGIFLSMSVKMLQNSRKP